MEALKDNFVFCLTVGWILFVAEIITVAVMFSDSESNLYKYCHLAWMLVAVFGLIMFLLQNISIYLY